MRNLRPCFKDHCYTQDIPTTPKTVPEPELHVLYRYRNIDDEWEDYDGGSISDWRCPLCNFHGIFNTREMLGYHVHRDHEEVQAIWSRSQVLGEQNGWTLSIQWSYQQTGNISQPAGVPETNAYDSKVSVILSIIPLDLILRSLDSEPRLMQDERIEREPSPDLNAQMSNVAITAHEDLPRLKCEEPDPTISSSIFGPVLVSAPVAGPPPTVESDGEPPRRKPRTGITENGQLIPPPKENKWGPAAEPPLESCRPEGPRIYDLLKELPLTDYGVYAWTIIDREEDLFEQEDLADEDKVMLALWNRWIMINRYGFRRNCNFVHFVTS